MLRHIPNRSDRPQQSPGVSEIFAPSIKRKPRSQVILRWEGFLNRYKSNTSIYNKLRNCNTKGWKRYPFLYLSSTSWSRRYTSAQLVELLDAKGFKAMQSASACLVTWWPLYWFLKLRYGLLRLLVLDDYWMLMDVVVLWQAKYDFVYLPIDFQNKVNLGWAKPCLCCSVAVTLVLLKLTLPLWWVAQTS